MSISTHDHWILNSVQTFQLTELSGYEVTSDSEPTLYSYSNFSFCSVSSFISAIAFVSHLCHLFSRSFVEVII